jgi:dTDP-3-amino-3,4,6-trideoxy-alpha-D-glucose transaminase
MQAAILRARLPHLAGWTTRRRQIAATYRDGLRDAALTLPPEHDAGHVYHLFPVLAADRAAAQAHLAAGGVETLIHYPVPIPRQPALAASDPRQCPIADRVCGEVFSLPMYPSLTDAEVAQVVEAARSFGA